MLITGARHGEPGTKSVHTTFEAAKAEFEPHAIRKREHLKARELEKQLAKKARR